MSQVFVSANQTVVVTIAGQRFTGNPAYLGQLVSFGAASSGISITLDSLAGGLYSLAQGAIVENINNLGGSEFADALTGNANANLLRGGGGDDNLSGSQGDDTLSGGSGDNVLDGGAGTDTVRYTDLTAGINASLGGSLVLRADGQDALFSIERLVGTDFADVLAGSAAAEELDGGAGADAIYGLEGDDTLLGGAGDDNLVGGDGNNLIDGGSGYDSLYYTASGVGITADLTAGLVIHGGGQDSVSGIEVIYATAQDDQLTGRNGTTVLYAEAGEDTLTAVGGNTTLFGGAGNDLLRSGVAADWLDGGADADTVSYAGATGTTQIDLATGSAITGAVQDFLFNIENVIGSNQSDTVFGSDADNQLEGGQGVDALVGGVGNDTLLGGDGDDQLAGGTGGNVIDGGAGFDQVYYNDRSASVNVSLFSNSANTGDGTDFLMGVEGAIGTNFADSLQGDNNTNILYGMGGADLTAGRGGDDVLVPGTGGGFVDGGDGYDTVSFQDMATDVTVNLAAGTFTTDAAGSIIDVEAVLGGAGSDSITGNAANNRLLGGAGNDAIVGGQGDDTLDGEQGSNFLDGGAGFDTADYTGSATSITVTGAIAVVHATGTDTLAGIELVLGSAGADSMTGGAGNDGLFGSAGDDLLAGAAGDDVLTGGAGHDILVGGSGVDSARYSQGASAYTVTAITLDPATLTSAQQAFLAAQGITGPAGAVRVTHNGSEGSDILIGIERIVFTDTVLSSLPLLPVPNAPVITVITPDTGASASDAVTSATSFAVSGTAQAGMTISLFINGVAAGSGTASNAGIFSINVTGVAPGRAQLTATATDPMIGGVSAGSDAFAVTVDGTAPAAVIITGLTPATDSGASSNDGVTNSGAPIITGFAEPGSIVEVFSDAFPLGRAITGGDGRWSLTATGIAAGQTTITATATDLAGNVSTASSTFALVVDRTAPDVTVTSDVDAVAVGQTATLTFSFSEAPVGFTLSDVSVGNGTLSNFQGSGTSYTATFTPAANVQTVSATASVAAGSYTDLAGNAGAAGSDATPIAIDTRAPTITGLASTTSGTYAAGGAVSVDISFSEQITGSVTVTFNSGGTATGMLNAASNTLTLTYNPLVGETALDLDVVSITTSATDAAGNVLSTVLPGGTGTLAHNADITIDTTAPVVDLDIATAGTGFLTIGESGVVDRVAGDSNVTDPDLSLLGRSFTTITVRMTAAAGDLGWQEGVGFQPAYILQLLGYTQFLGYSVTGNATPTLTITAPSPAVYFTAAQAISIIEELIYGGSATDYTFNPNDRIVTVQLTDAAGNVSNLATTTIDMRAVVGAGAGQHVFTGANLGDDILGSLGDDTLDGAGGNDTIDGDEGNDSLIGGTGDDMLLACDGDDTLDGGAGNDALNGEAGTDTARFSGAASDYTFTPIFGLDGWSLAAGSTITDNRAGSPDGTDSLEAIEFLDFATGADIDLSQAVRLFSGTILLGGFATVQAAIDSGLGDRIVIKGDLYNQPAETLITLNRGMTIEGLAGFKPTLGAFLLTGAAVDTAGETLTLKNLAIAKANAGANSSGVMLQTAHSANETLLGSLVLDNVDVSGAFERGIAVYGGGTALSVTIQNGSSVTGAGGTLGGMDPVSFYEFTGNLNVSGLSVSAPVAGTGHGVQIAGFQDPGTPDKVITSAIGTVNLAGLTVEGAYGKTFLYIQGYNDLTGLGVSGTQVGSAGGSSFGWVPVFVDGGRKGAGAYTTDATPPSGLNLAGLVFNGGTFTGGPGAFAQLQAANNAIVFAAGVLTADSITGGAGNEVLAGGTGNDTMDAGAGQDLVIWTAGGGFDTVAGGFGNDTLAGYGSTIIDTFTLTGTGFTHDDANNSMGGASLSGFEAVTLFGGGGGNLVGGDAFVIYGKPAFSVFLDADGAGLGTPDLGDVLILNVATHASVNLATGAVVLDVTDPTNTSLGIANFETVQGGNGNDSITGNSAANRLLGEAGNDTVVGGDGNDQLTGGTGQDSVNGGVGNDSLTYMTGDGRDVILDGGFDTMGGGNVDLLYIHGGGTIHARVVGGTLVELSSDADALTGANNITSIERFQLAMDGSATATLDYDITAQAVTVNLGAAIPLATGFNGSGSFVSGVRNVIGGAGNDTITGNNADNILAGGAGGDGLTGGAGNDMLVGGAGTDTAANTATLTDVSFTLLATDTDPYTGGVQTGWQVVGDGTDALNGVEVVTHGGAGRFLLVGNGGFASIQAAVDASQSGDTILVAAGTYTEQVLISGKSDLTIQGIAGPVIIKALSAIANQGLANSIYSGNPIAGVVAVDGSSNIVLKGLTIDGDLQAANKAAGVNTFTGIFSANSTLTVQNSTITNVRGDDAWFGVQDGLAVYAQGGSLTMTGSTVSNFQKQAITAYQTAVTISGNTITGVGVHAVQAQNGIVVGDFANGVITANTITGLGYSGPANTFGSGIMLLGSNDVSDGASALTVAGNTVTGAGATPSKFAAVYVEHDINGNVSTLSGNTLSNAQYGVYEYVGDGYTALTNPSTNAPTFTLDNNTYTGNGINYELDTDGTVAASITRTGTAGVDDTNGGAGSDNLLGLGGADSIRGGAGNDALTGGGDNDFLDGGAGSDTAKYGAGVTAANITAIADADPVTAGNQAGWQVVSTAEGTDTLTGVEIVLSGASRFLLVGGGGFATIDAAIAAAVAGDTILVGPGDFAGFTLDKAVTIRGANAGIDGSNPRGAETNITSASFVTLATGGAGIDGVTFRYTGPTQTAYQALTLTGASTLRVENSCFMSDVANGTPGSRGIMVGSAFTGAVTIDDNLFGGLQVGQANKFAGANWRTGIWSDGNATLTVSGNLFENVRTGINLDGYDNTSTVIGGNFFLTSGSGISVGTPTGSSYTGISSNRFTDVNTDFNLQNVGSPAITFDLGGSSNEATDLINFLAGGQDDVITGWSGADSLVGNNGADSLDGAGGPDWLNGAGGNDLLTGGADNDSLDGGADIDTALYAGAITSLTYDGPGWTVVSATEGTDTVVKVERIDADGPGGAATWLVADDAQLTIALANAVTGDTVKLAAGTYTGNYSIISGITLVGAQEGVAGTGRATSFVGTPDANETVLYGDWTVANTAAAVTINGVTFRNAAANTSGFNDINTPDGNGALLRLNNGSGNTITNTVFWSEVRGGEEDWALYGTSSATNTTVSNSYFGGTQTSLVAGEQNFHRAVWLDTPGTITGNTFDHVRNGINQESYDGTGLIANNIFSNSFAAVSYGPLAVPPVSYTINGTTLQNNVFTNNQIDVNARNFTVRVNVDLTSNTGSAIAVLGGAGADTLTGGASSDILIGNLRTPGSATSTESDMLSGGGGNDTLYGMGGFDMLFGDAGDDVLFGSNGSGALRIDAAVGDLVFDGAAPEVPDFGDNLIGGSGNDTLDGGAGFNNVLYDADGGSGAVNVNLASGTATDTWGNTDTLISIQGVSGTSLDDTIQGDGFTNLLLGRAGQDQLVGNGGDDILEGGAGNDTLTGGNGNDTLIGGANTDVLAGGSGSDRFRFNATGDLAPVGVNGVAGSEDGITDFSVADDTIEFLTSGFSFVGLTAGALPVLNFVNGDLDNAFGYGTSNGQTTFVLDAAPFGSPLIPGTVGTLYVDITGDGTVDFRVASFDNGSALGSFGAADIFLM